MGKIRLPALGLLGLLLTGVNASGYAQMVFGSLTDIWQYADKNNHVVQTAVHVRRLAEKTAKQAYSGLWPTLTANGSFTDNIRIQPTLIPANLLNASAPEGTFVESTFGRRYIYTASLVAQLNLVNSDDWFSVASARYNSDIARLSEQQTRRQVYEQTAQAYYSYLLLREVVRLSEQTTRISDQMLTLARQRLAEGQVGEPSVNAAQITRLKAEQTGQVASQNSLQALYTLKSLLGLSVQDSIRLPETLSDSLASSVVGSAMTHPEVQLAYTQSLLAERTFRAARASYLPRLSLVYQWNHQISGDRFWQFSNTNTLPQEYWGLRLSIPILSGGSRLYQVQKSQMDWQYQQRQYDHVLKQADIQDASLLLSYATARETLLKSRTVMYLYKQNDAHADRQFAEEQMSLDERLRFLNEYISAQNEYLTHLSDYLIYHYRLQLSTKSF
jgi:outer membrane protein TolC